MKWYLASRTRHTQKMQEIAKHVIEQNQEISSDWIYITENLKPFTQNLKKVEEISGHNLKQMLDTDVFVMFNDLAGTDIFTELGIMMAKNKIGKPVKIYVVGEYEQASLMQYNSAIIHTKILKEVFDFEKINYGNFSFPEIF